MSETCFLLSKDPYGFEGGDTRISRLVIEAAARVRPVRVLALSETAAPGAPAPVPVRRVAKPPLNRIRCLASGAARGRSSVHERYCVPELIAAIRDDPATTLVAEHIYMAAPALAADGDGRRLHIHVHVLPSDVLAAMHPVARLESRRVARDERRCVLAARSARCLGEQDAERLRGWGVRDVDRLDMILPPAAAPAPVAGRRALFLGDRAWPPNAEALAAMLELWPRIAAGTPGAELLVVGRGPVPRRLPEGVRVLGFVDDLEALWDEVAVLLAPVRTGGGVRVKILEAVARGVPVVTTAAGLGALGGYLPLDAARDDDAFCADAAELLADAPRRRAEGMRLWEAARERWESGLIERQIEAWLPAGAHVSGAVA